MGTKCIGCRIMKNPRVQLPCKHFLCFDVCPWLTFYKNIWNKFRPSKTNTVHWKVKQCLELPCFLTLFSFSLRKTRKYIRLCSWNNSHSKVFTFGDCLDKSLQDFGTVFWKWFTIAFFLGLRWSDWPRSLSWLGA